MKGNDPPCLGTLNQSVYLKNDIGLVAGVLGVSAGVIGVLSGAMIDRNIVAPVGTRPRRLTASTARGAEDGDHGIFGG